MQLGGTHVGWIGERSVPVTSADGNWSAKSLERSKHQDIANLDSPWSVHCPYACPSANVEHMLRAGPNRSEEELVIHGMQKSLVAGAVAWSVGGTPREDLAASEASHQIKAFILLLVVGAIVFGASPVVMERASVDLSIPEDAGRDRCRRTRTTRGNGQRLASLWVSELLTRHPPVRNQRHR